MGLGVPPSPTAPWRNYIFRVHCVVTQRWMKIRVPFAWFWYGEEEYGTPEVESGTIAAGNPKPPALGPRLAPGTPLPGDGPQMSQDDLPPPYVHPNQREQQAAESWASPEQRIAELEERLRAAERQASSAFDMTHPQGYGR